jgi:hypothetical protein
MAVNFAYEIQYLFLYLLGSLTCRKILRHGTDGFTSSPKEGVLRIFIGLKNLSSSAGFEPASLGSNGWPLDDRGCRYEGKFITS